MTEELSDFKEDLPRDEHLEPHDPNKLKLKTGEKADRETVIGVVSALNRLHAQGHTSALIYAASLPSESELQQGKGALAFEHQREYDLLRGACLVSGWNESDSTYVRHSLPDDVATVVRCAVQVNEKHPYASQVDSDLTKLAAQGQGHSGRIAR